MCCLAVGIEPPGDFWEKPRNFDETVRKMTVNMQLWSHKHSVIDTTKGNTQSNSPYLWSSLQTRILDDFTNPNTPWVFSCTPTLSSTLTSLNYSCQNTKVSLSSSLLVSSPLSR